MALFAQGVEDFYQRPAGHGDARGVGGPFTAVQNPRAGGEGAEEARQGEGRGQGAPAPGPALRPREARRTRAHKPIRRVMLKLRPGWVNRSGASLAPMARVFAQRMYSSSRRLNTPTSSEKLALIS